MMEDILPVGNNTYEFYDITSKGNSILLERMQGKTMEDLVALFMRTPLLSGRSFNIVYSSIPFVNVD